MTTLAAALTTAHDTLTAEADALANAAATLNQQHTHLIAALNTILPLAEKGGALIVTGVGKSGHIGAKIAATLASTGTKSYFVSATDATHGDLGMITPTDAVLALSHSGETAELGGILTYCQSQSIPVIAITGPKSIEKNSTLVRLSSHVLSTGVVKEACPHNLAPTTSTTVALALGDALATALMTLRGFTRQDFAVRHPAGTLGAQFLKVRDVMRTGADNLPLLPQTANLADVFAVSRQYNCGSVGLTDEAGVLTGILTDGDFKRVFAGDTPIHPRSVIAASVMTPTPITVPADDLAGNALALMRERAISGVWVVDQPGHPIGLLTVALCHAHKVQ